MIIDSILLTFAADHAVAAFFLSWPLMLLLLGVANFITSCIVGAMNLLLAIARLGVILLRGYPVAPVVGLTQESEGSDDDLAE